MMKLSEAIRLGATLRPQGFGELMADGKSCAWGAAYEAIGNYTEVYRMTLPVDWQWFHKGSYDCPQCGMGKRQTGETVIHLNDFHHWTREQIADWVEEREREMEAKEELQAPAMVIK